MFKYHQAKREYYNGSPVLTDFEFDRLEGSIIAIHGEEIFRKYNSVGFEYNTLRAIEVIYDFWCSIVKNYEDMSNREALESNSKDLKIPIKIIEVDLSKSVIKMETIVIEKIFNVDDNGSQLLMF